MEISTRSNTSNTLDLLQIGKRQPNTNWKSESGKRMATSFPVFALLSSQNRAPAIIDFKCIETDTMFATEMDD
jgi:hypothetical protein